MADRRTSTPAFDAPPAGGAPSRELGRGTLAGLAVAAVVICWLLVNRDFALIAGFVIVGAFWYRADPGRPVALGAFVLVVAAAIATVVEVSPTDTDPTLTFAPGRPVAAQMANLAGALLAVAVVLFAAVERPAASAPRWQPATSRTAMVRAAADRLAGRAGWVVAGAAVGLVAVAVRVVLAPTPLPAGADVVVRSLRAGSGFLGAGADRALAGADHPPLAPLLVAFAPVGARVLLLVASVAVVAATAKLAHRLAGPTAALVAAVVAAVAPSLWDQQLPVVLAALCLTGAVVLADPARIDLRRAVGAGAVCGLAVLARPDALVAVAVVVGWLVWSRRRGSGAGVDESTATVTDADPDRAATAAGHHRWVPVAVLAAVALVVVLPWWTEVWRAAGPLRPIGSVGAFVREPGAQTRLPMLAVLASGGLLAAAAAAATVRRLDWWRPRAWRWLPVLVLPAAGLGLAAAAGPARDALSWAAPMAAVLVGVGVADLVPTRWLPSSADPAWLDGPASVAAPGDDGRAPTR